MNQPHPLEHEIDFYMAHLDRWLGSHRGKWIAIQGDRFTDFWVGFDAVLRDGYKQFGVDKPFLVRQVSEEYRQFGKYGKSEFVGISAIELADKSLASLL